MTDWTDPAQVVAARDRQIKQLQAENKRLRVALRLALRWLPTEDMIERAAPRAQIRAIRAALTHGEEPT